VKARRKENTRKSKTYRWVDNINMERREIGLGGMQWIDLDQDEDRLRALVNTVMNFPVP
jgi:hypothetical protein